MSELFKRAIAPMVSVLRSVVERLPRSEKLEAEAQLEAHLVALEGLADMGRKTARAISELEEIVDRATAIPPTLEGLADASPQVRADLDAWLVICEAQNKDRTLSLGETTHKGTKYFVVEGPHGRHLSAESHAAAFAELVDAHAIGAEHTGEARDLVWWAEDDGDAGRVLAEIAAETYASHPKMSRKDRDALVLERLAALDAEEAEHHGIAKTSGEARKSIAAEAIAKRQPRLAAVRGAAGAAVPLEKALLRSAESKEKRNK